MNIKINKIKINYIRINRINKNRYHNKIIYMVVFEGNLKIFYFILILKPSCRLSLNHTYSTFITPHFNHYSFIC